MLYYYKYEASDRDEEFYDKYTDGGQILDTFVKFLKK